MSLKVLPPPPVVDRRDARPGGGSGSRRGPRRTGSLLPVRSGELDRLLLLDMAVIGALLLALVLFRAL